MKISTIPKNSKVQGGSSADPDSLEERWLRRWQDFLSKEATGAWGIEKVSYFSPLRQFSFHHSRRFKFDFAFPGRTLVAVEIQGGTGKWSRQGKHRGMHSRPEGFDRDAEKSRLAASLGWRVLTFTTADVMEGRGFPELFAALRWKP